MFVSPVKSTTFKSIVETRRAEPINQQVIQDESAAKAETPVDTAEITPQKRRVNPLAVTGWTAAGGFGVAAISGITRNPKIHKASAIIGACAAAAHIGLVYGHHHSHKQAKNVQA